MRKALPFVVAAIVLSGCSAGSTSGTDAVSAIPPDRSSTSGTAASTAPSPAGSPLASGSSSAAPSASATPTLPDFPTGDDWALVSKGLARAGAQSVLDAAASGRTIVASVVTGDTTDDFDAGLVYSQDAGQTWTWGGVIPGPGGTFPEAVLLESKDIVLVGSTQTNGPSGLESQAFLATASPTDFVPREVVLPAAFNGVGVQLQDIVSVDGEWVITGFVTGAPDAKGKKHPAGVLWRSADRGATWTRQDVAVPGAEDVVFKAMAIAPDGSWNIVGQVSGGSLITQYDMLWLRSTDAGATFSQVAKDTLTADYDQGATRIEFASDGTAAVLGWTEVTEDHGSDSALWIGASGHGVSQIGTGGVPVQGSNPSGQFLDGILWQGTDLIAWGSADGSYPMPEAEFWNLTHAQLVPIATLPGNGTSLDVARMLTVDGSAIGLGFTGSDTNTADVGVWRAPLRK